MRRHVLGPGQIAWADAKTGEVIWSARVESLVVEVGLPAKEESRNCDKESAIFGDTEKCNGTRHQKAP